MFLADSFLLFGNQIWLFLVAAFESKLFLNRNIFGVFMVGRELGQIDQKNILFCYLIWVEVLFRSFHWNLFRSFSWFFKLFWLGLLLLKKGISNRSRPGPLSHNKSMHLDDLFINGFWVEILLFVKIGYQSSKNLPKLWFLVFFPWRLLFVRSFLLLLFLIIFRLTFNLLFFPIKETIRSKGLLLNCDYFLLKLFSQIFDINFLFEIH